ncbi:class I SAM-dependent methyltransferase [cf. Phormidesmis sp. LEGE 11477]|uniref:class I SAM-dependent methyltransferase n=1 Tax=cf. Phormidesmis sp. LEGE 11477 TaxID=1828680 RepID=UPI0018802882|nr:class I SAM-dependent methyltransferase [cf. Phormidesmis sp. LEGE 11477]MBE9063347.1 class I SAM-dependent methyltransferase [cf. Phormidesmis sp. LEGE 11477]
MTAIATFLPDSFKVSLVNGLLSVKPLAKFARQRARKMMMDRAETIGVYWRDEVKALERRDHAARTLAADAAAQVEQHLTDKGVNPVWEEELKAIADPTVQYPPYYTTKFHAYDEGNLGWLPAMEVDVAARAVHAKIWTDERSGINGDASLRASYHQILSGYFNEIAAAAPNDIIDLGCGVGMSSIAIAEAFPNAQVTGVDLSPYFLTVGQYRLKQLAQPLAVRWKHAAAEATGLKASSADLVSAFLVFHELPTSAAKDLLAEAARLVRPGGHFAIMDMNPASPIYREMPPYVFTLLKSTEPYLDQYFALDIDQAFQAAGFSAPRTTSNSPRHRTIVGRKL